jgi:hypothetical protein
MKPIRILLTLAASVAGTFLAIQISPRQASAQGGKSGMRQVRY